MDNIHELEGRFRGMLLANSRPNGQQQSNAQQVTPNFPQLQRPDAPQVTFNYPQIHLANPRSTMNHPEVHEMKFVSANHDVDPQSIPTGSNALNQPENQAPSNSGRKKPNQAERRQTGSLLSISIGSRLQAPGLASGGGNVASQSRSMGISSQNNSQMNKYHKDAPYGGNFQHHDQYASRIQPRNKHLYQSDNSNGDRGRNTAMNLFTPDVIHAQSEFLQRLIFNHVPQITCDQREVDVKEAFRVLLQQTCRQVITQHEALLGNSDFVPTTVQLVCFGSMASGLATKSSDMDLALISPLSGVKPDSDGSPIPRLLEKALLELSLGARLLEKTRIPILKVCERPSTILMSNLQTERRKFERGAAEDHNQIRPQEVVKPADQPTPRTSFEINVRKSSIEASPTDEKSPEYLLSTVFQKEKQHLAEYFAATKRVLYKLGGYDVGLNGPVGMPAVRDDKVVILNNVSKAFINGILDEDMKRELLRINLPSFALPYQTPVSLSGVYAQAEIQRLVKKWTSRKIREKTGHQEEQCYRVINQWEQLEWKAPDNQLRQNKQLYQLLDAIKRIYSLQFAALEQLPRENAFQYYFRMNSILQNVSPNMDPATNPAIISQYVKGIYDPLIKKRMLHLTRDAENELMTPRALRFHHAILDLANEYEEALTFGLYGEAHRPAVESYIGLLRAPSDLDGWYSQLYFHGLTHDEDALKLTSMMKELPDPSRRANSRDRYHDVLSFPPDDSVGIQCDINFSAELGLHNTHLLRCYCAADPRVQPLVLFVKSWASRRGINSPYRGTLSSYGYVLMVLHYLVNVAAPFVVPNLQVLKDDPDNPILDSEMCKGRNIRFWKDLGQIKDLASKNMLNVNKDSPGKLLRGFFEYYANNGANCHGFEWVRDVLSLRTFGGILSKVDKNWVAARNETVVIGQGKPARSDDPESMGSQATTKEVRHRFLFAIEDPFELEHNVARTVNHDGIVSIRDEFRRAWRIIKDHGVPNFDANRVLNGQDHDLLAEIASKKEEVRDSGYKILIDEVVMGGLHGWAARGGVIAKFLTLNEGRANVSDGDELPSVGDIPIPSVGDIPIKAPNPFSQRVQ